MSVSIYGSGSNRGNHAGTFWKVGEGYFREEDWETAQAHIRREFFDFKAPLDDFLDWILTERQFGRGHWRLGLSKRLFYRAKPVIPASIRLKMRRFYSYSQKMNGMLQWPIEDRYVRFQKRLVQDLLKKKGLQEVPYIRFWPGGKDFAFVITHDVETEEGYRDIPRLVELEKKFGFRSLFTIVPEKYKIDTAYLAELRADGFEIGLHGLKHDGHLFFSKKAFSRREKAINKYIDDWGVQGFRSPFSHRNPDWMKGLKCDYDLSFFDTDPYEPMPGGTMSIWPFFLHDFVELPYTLPQDFTLFIVKEENSIDIWRDKIDFIEKEKGMVLFIAHPDYINFINRPQKYKYSCHLYEQLLSFIKTKENYWHALPKDVAKWWRSRASSALRQVNGKWEIEPGLEGAEIGRIRSDKEILI